jgi:glutathione-specific gamma-glutamylcyclotransferase
MATKIVSEVELSKADTQSDHKADLWVFGYGSLMWRPGFEFIEQVPARLIGEHRALCVYSFDHRGTPEKPGLVLGLDRGGACRGIAFRVAGSLRDATVDYLRAREQTTNVYREVTRSVWLDNAARERVSALTYVADRGHVPDGYRSPSSCVTCSMATAVPATTAIMCWKPSRRSRRKVFATSNCTGWR